MGFKWLTFSLLSLISLTLKAQSGSSVFPFLNIPASVSAAGVGGNSVSSPVEDLNLTFHNPAILSTAMNKDVSVGYMRYIADINIGSLAYAHRVNDRSVWMAGLRYLDYGSMLWTTPENEVLGNTYAQDMALTGAYSWMLSPRWRAGGSLNLIYSVMDEYTSTGLAVDLGLFFNDPDRLLSAGLVVKSLGSQFASYDGTYENLPLDVQLGLSKKLSHAPFRFTLTAQQLLDWDRNVLKDGIKRMDNLGNAALKHLLMGLEFVPTDHFLLSLGYNYRRKSDLQIDQRTSFGGFSGGFSLQVKKIKIGTSFAKYHGAGSSLQMTLGMNTSNIGL